MSSLLSIGSSGPQVRELQSMLNICPSDLQLLAEDGLFGPKTQARVKEFQRDNNLVDDGIVGPKTMAALEDSCVAPAALPRVDCGTGDPDNHGRAFSLRSFFAPLFAASEKSSDGLAGILGSITGSVSSAAPNVRPLTAAEITSASAVYGTSIDFSRVFISDVGGAGGRAFTTAVPNPNGAPIQIMNCGATGPSADTLIHELAHVWQSQHHSNAFAFMANAAASQSEAAVRNVPAGAFSPTVRADKDWPVHFPFSAYAFVPGKPFGEYAAEQIAYQVEKNVAAIRSHVKSIGAGAVDSDNVTSLATIRVQDCRAPGAVR